MVMEEAEQRVKQSNLKQVPYPHQALQHLSLRISLLVLVVLIQKGERGLLDPLRRHSI